jgi:hypothetical protein
MKEIDLETAERERDDVIVALLTGTGPASIRPAQQARAIETAEREDDEAIVALLTGTGSASD